MKQAEGVLWHVWGKVNSNNNNNNNNKNRMIQLTAQGFIYKTVEVGTASKRYLQESNSHQPEPVLDPK